MPEANQMTWSEIQERIKDPPVGGDFVWDGVDEDDRPMTDEELDVGIALARKMRDEGRLPKRSTPAA